MRQVMIQENWTPVRFAAPVGIGQPMPTPLVPVKTPPSAPVLLAGGAVVGAVAGLLLGLLEYSMGSNLSTKKSLTAGVVAGAVGGAAAAGFALLLK